MGELLLLNDNVNAIVKAIFSIRSRTLLPLVLSTLNPHSSTLFAQGSLTPPGAPAPTMKSLDQIEPRTPISSLPYTISSGGSYYVTTNLTGLGGSSKGVTISSGNVTLDLNGFALLGVPGSAECVFISGSYTNITVRNGTIGGWGNGGVNAYFTGVPRNLVFERLTISGNSGFGIISQGPNIIRDCLSQNNGTGIASYGGLISGCVARDNSIGIIAYGSCLVRDCQAAFNSSGGISLFDNSTVSGCNVLGNPSSGISVQGNGSRISGNNCYSNNSGIFISGNNNRIEDNQVAASVVAGIQVAGPQYTNNVIIRNTVSGSGANNFSSIGTNNDLGPVGSAATNSSPWGNLSH